MTTKHTLMVMVEDRPGVLARVASLWRRRGFNIESLSVGRTVPHRDGTNLSRMTLVVRGEAEITEQVRKQLQKLIHVWKALDITADEIVTRELVLIKVTTTPATRGEIMQIVDIFRANIVDVSQDSLVIEATGDEQKIDSLYRLLQRFKVTEFARTGAIAVHRGTVAAIDVEEKEVDRRHRTRQVAKSQRRSEGSDPISY